ncbi:hypothetical protein IQ266_02750 [filamentous cyanobacterium LEGE 11480]|uniref:Uncharacterized protein n=1 Tax=Romeriopsis navalis LEGE 11480 TaxID=2777977 RepID=A0A928VL83_9CYAN|nr:hypothetical protein [Romeriopsis navalis]MBE9028676.1 hypothetical protein [Romeriopsis navalis LEGE 11480]
MQVLRFFSISLFVAIAFGLTSSVQTQTQAANPCNFTQRSDLKLKRSERYGMFGDDEFDTVVCGYLVTRETKIWDETVNVAYLRITKFAQLGFQQAIAQNIQQGNSVNVLRQGKYEFNLGCFDGTRITGKQYEPEQPYLTTAVQSKILSSSKTQPIALLLSFGKHLGSDCECCNLAHRIRIY